LIFARKSKAQKIEVGSELFFPSISWFGPQTKLEIV